MGKLIIYANSLKPVRKYPDEKTRNIQRASEVMLLLDEWYLRSIDKSKCYDLLHHYPLDFIITWNSNKKDFDLPKYHFYNIIDMLNFINFIKWESTFHYLGLPGVLERQIESFMSMVARYIPAYKYYCS